MLSVVIGALLVAGCPAEPVGLEVLPESRNPGSVKVFARDGGGFDLFWIQLESRPPRPLEIREPGGRPPDGSPVEAPPPEPQPGPRFGTYHARLDSDGFPVGAVKRLFDDGAHHVAQGERGAYAFIVQLHGPRDAWQAHVRIVDGQRDLVRDVAVPLEGAGHGTFAVSWNRATQEWIVAGEEQIQQAGAPLGYVYSRLLAGRLSPSGDRWTQRARYLSDTNGSAMISDWATPIVGDTILWAQFRSPSDVRVRVTRIGGATTEIAGAKGFGRGTIVRIEHGHALAWAEQGTLRYTTLVGGAVGEIVDLSTPGEHASEVAMAADGKRVIVGWHEGTGGSVVRIAFPGQKPKELGEKREGEHDWIQSIATDGCRFAVVWLKGINPSAAKIELVP